jgi:hypothetical protein
MAIQDWSGYDMPNTVSGGYVAPAPIAAAPLAAQSSPSAVINQIYAQELGRAPDAAGAAFWTNALASGASVESIRQAFQSSPEAIVNQAYQAGLGRAPDEGGAAYFQQQLASGRAASDIAREIARSQEGQNFLTQGITSEYRQTLGRNPEQEGYQYWLSSALDAGYTVDQLRAAINSAALPEQQKRGITEAFTQLQLADLEADPWAGRYATRSIYDIPQSEADRINISYINGVPVQFVAPTTQQQYISNFGQAAWNAIAGDEVLSVPRVTEQVNRAYSAGSLTQGEYKTIIDSLAKAKEPADVRKILGIPQGAVIIDPEYGQQIGEDNNLKLALAEAAKRQAVLSAQDPGYYQASDVLGQAYLDAGLPWDFMSNTYKADTMMTQANKLTPENFNQKVNDLLKALGSDYTGKFGGMNDMQTPGLGQYYSETGLQPGFTPFGTEGTTFRSGVAGYIPQAELPTGFQFGAPPVNATFQQYRPGAFQPEGVTTGGFITGYNTNGTPIYSTYANPNVNVGGAMSALNPFTPVQAGAISSLQDQLSAMQLASAAANPLIAGGN